MRHKLWKKNRRANLKKKNKVNNSKEILPDVPNDIGTKWQSILPRCQVLAYADIGVNGTARQHIWKKNSFLFFFLINYSIELTYENIGKCQISNKDIGYRLHGFITTNNNYMKEIIRFFKFFICNKY